MNRPPDPWGGPAAPWTAAPDPYRVPAAPVTPAAPPRAVPPDQWVAYRAAPARPGYPPSGYWPAQPATGMTSSVWPFIVAVAGVVIAIVVVASAVVAVTKQRSSSSIGGSHTTAELPPPPTAEIPTTTPISSSELTTTPTSTAPTPTGTAALRDNPLFADPDVGLVRQVCNTDGWPRDSEAGKVFFDSLIPCLDGAWEAALTTAGLPYHAPAVVVPSATIITSPCGTANLATEPIAAFYCGANETLYMPPQGLQVDYYGAQPIIYVAVFAHEYGHHIQKITGILRAEHRAEKAAGFDSDTGLELSRRTELEAQCFSGMFVGSIIDTGGAFTRADYQIAYDDQLRGDPPGELQTHGTSAHEQDWWQLGGENDRVGLCNTWSASSADVS